MELLVNKSINLNEWGNLIESSNFSSPFQTPEYYELINNTINNIALIFATKSNNTLNSACLVTIQKESGIKGHFSKRAIIYGGPVFRTGYLNESLALLNYIKSWLRKKVIYIEIRAFHDYSIIKEDLIQNGWSYIPYLNFQLEINNNSVENLLSNMKYNRKREIKISLNEGAIYREAINLEEIDNLYNILKDLYKDRVKLPLPDKSYFEGMFKNKIGVVFVVLHNNIIIGGSFNLFYKNVSIYTNYYCGLRNYHKKIYPTHLAIIAVINFAINSKIKYIDFMGAGKPNQEYGVRKYKSEFGGKMVENGRYLFVCNNFLYKLGKLAIKLIK